MNKLAIWRVLVGHGLGLRDGDCTRRVQWVSLLEKSLIQFYRRSSKMLTKNGRRLRR